jgi:hypothetical protein
VLNSRSLQRTVIEWTDIDLDPDKITLFLKSVPRLIHSSFNEDLLPRLGKSRFIRLPCDTIPNQRIYVYKYMDNDLLSLVRREASIKARKQILKARLQGIAELHSHDMAHLGK